MADCLGAALLFMLVLVSLSSSSLSSSSFEGAWHPGNNHGFLSYLKSSDLKNVWIRQKQKTDNA